MIWFYKILDYPQIPENLVQNALSHLYSTDLFQTPKNDLKINWDYTRNAKIFTDNVEKINAPTIGWDLNDEIKDWFNTNISSNIENLRVSTTEPDGFFKDTQGAHRDMSRNFVLTYLLDAGGDNVKTRWYQEEDKPIIRERGERCNDHRKLKLLEETVFPIKSWCLINGTILHAVHNMTRPRKSIQAGFFNIEDLNVTF